MYADKKCLLLFFTLMTSCICANSADESQACSATISENTKSNSMILNIHLTNVSSSSRQFTYKLISDSSAYFKLESDTGWLRTSHELDRESLCLRIPTCQCQSNTCFVDLKVLRTPTGQPSGRPEILHNRVCINDINDNPPQLPTNYLLKLNENSPMGTKKPLPIASDADSLQNSVKNYVLNCPNQPSSEPLPFKLEYHDTGIKIDSVWLTVVGSLDREKTSSYTCQVSATDGTHSDSMVLNVEVQDVNDNKPEWIVLPGKPSTNSFTVSIPESTSAYSTIYTLKAKDADSQYSKITYQLGPQIVPENIRQLFSINPQFGEVKINSAIDYDDPANRVFLLPVVAYDNGQNPQHSVTGTLTVSIHDVNDNPPDIKPEMTSIKIEENSPPRYLFYVSVSDKDTGLNGEISCHLKRGTHQFELKRMDTDNMYAVNLLTPLDHEKATNYVLRITCQDKGDRVLERTAEIYVHVTDVNDSPPRFERRHFIANVTEGNQIGSSLIWARAVDKDSESELTYSIDSSAQEYAHINTNTGEIYSHIEFDRERQPPVNYTFKVFVKDSKAADPSSDGNHTDSAIVTLNIMDINDNDPVFQNTYRFNVPENATLGWLVGQVEAVDKDAEENGTVEYYQTPGIASPYFRVSIDGKITVSRELDREKLAHFELKVVAKDRGTPAYAAKSATAIVVIQVTDINDSEPRFPQGQYTRNISCHQHYVAMDIQAIDPDEAPENNKIVYTLLQVYPQTNRDKPIFTVTPENGDIVMTDPPDQCEQLGGTYRLMIKASDPTRPEFQHKTHVTVYIQRGPRVMDQNGAGQKRGSGGGGYRTRNSQRDVNLFIVVALVCFLVVLAVLVLALIVYLKKRQEERDRGYGQGMTITKKGSQGDADVCLQPPSSCPLPRKQLPPYASTTMSSQMHKNDYLCSPEGQYRLENDEMAMRLRVVEDEADHEDGLKGNPYQHLQHQQFHHQQVMACDKDATWNPKMDTINAWVSLENSHGLKQRPHEEGPYHTYQTMPSTPEGRHKFSLDQTSSQISKMDGMYTQLPTRSREDDLKMATLNSSNQDQTLRLQGKAKKPYCTISFV